MAGIERVEALTVFDAELAGLVRERKANEAVMEDLKSERDARHQSEREHAVSRERLAVVEQVNLALQQDNQRLRKSDEAALELPNLTARI